jgi:hypothetical protein
VEKDGWGKLYVYMNPWAKSHELSVKAYFAAGYLEGALTYEHIYNHYWSWWDYTYAGGTNPPSEELIEFMFDQDAYTRMLIV